MDIHKTLYKDQRCHALREHVKINRKLQEDNRAKHRRDRFQNSRKISLSPDRRIKENKENMECPNTDRMANPENCTKKEAFIRRFVEWKEAKKNVIKPEKKKPFISCGSSSRQTITSSSFVPKGHHKGFHPPAGLNNTVHMNKVDANKILVKDKGRQSFYTLVPTPKKKPQPVKLNNKISSARKDHTKLLDINRPPIRAMSLVRSCGKTISANNNTSQKTPGGTKKEPFIKSTSSKSTAKAAQQPVKKDLKLCALKMPPPPAFKPTLNVAKRPVGAVGKTKAFAQRKENVKPIKKTTLKSVRLAQNLKAKKNVNNKKINLTSLKINSKEILNIIKNNEPNENMVVQTPRDFATLNPFSEFVTSTKIKDKECSQNIQIEVIETFPKKMYGTSSAKRNILGGNDENALNAVKEVTQQNAKRFNFIRYSEAKDISDNGDSSKFTTTNEDDKTLVEGADIIDTTPTKSGPEERPPNYLSPYVSVTRGKVSFKKEKEKRNSIYLQNTTESQTLLYDINTQNSPTHSLEIRRTLEAVRYFRLQLQDEIDRLHKLCDIWEAYKEEHLEKIQNANGEDMINVTIGQTRLLTSKKFMQFKGLIDRCEARSTGVGDVEYDGSENTKTITSVDLEGFWSMLGLQVDNLDKRFETLNRWKANDWMDPDEVKPKIKNNLNKVKKRKADAAAKSKPNSALQQMLRKMQAEMRKNKNKTDDTNEIVVLTSSKQQHNRSASSNNSTPKKSLDSNTSHSVSVIVKDRKYYSPVATVIAFSSTNRRASLRRKSSQESPNRRASLRRKTSEDSPKLKNIVQMFNNDLDTLQDSLYLRKSVLVNENSRRKSSNSKSPLIYRKGKDSKNSNNLIYVNNKTVDVVQNEYKTKTFALKCSSTQSTYTSPVASGRKSILKTPGTAKSRLRNVIFNEKLRVKKFNFLINDNDENRDESNDSHEEDLAKCEEVTKEGTERTLTLRNRKVRLRPSCEIVIPKK